MANTIDVMDITDIIGKDRFANSWWFDKVTNTAGLKTLCPIVLEQRVLLKFNGNEFTNTAGVTDIVINWPILLAWQMLHLVVLLGQTGLLTFNGLMSWLTLLALQTLHLVALLEQTCLLMFNGVMSSLTLLA